jgi:hypothetical protein
MDQAHRLPSSAIPSPSKSAASEPRWKRLYEAALLEINPLHVPEAIAVARRAIFDRANEIMTAPAKQERIALDSALRILQTLEQVAAKEAAGRDVA